MSKKNIERGVTIMKNNKSIAAQTRPRTEQDTLKAVLMYILPVLAVIFLRIAKLNNEADTKIVMRMVLAGLACYGIFKAYKGSFNAATAVKLIIIAGMAVRVGYMVYTHAFTRGYDIGMNNETGVGHWGYLYHVINGHLPPSNEYQFYQPPLFYIISAIAIKVVMLFTGSTDWTQYLYVSQAVSCVASCIVLIYLEKIMDALRINKTVQIAALIITAFYPAQILTAGRMNNDSLVVMFMVLALYFTLKWHQSENIKYIVCTAFAIGFAMMTKINGAMVAFVTGPIMIYHFVRCIRAKDREKIKNIIIQFAVFAVIVFPCGLWYPVRNYILFDQPLNFVHDLGENSFVYTGDASWVDRWIRFPLFHFKDSPYMDMGNDTNIFMSLIKTGVHGEFSYDELSEFLAWSIEYVHLILILFTAFAIAFTMLRNRKIDRTQKWSAFWVWALMAVSYIQFNIAYPFMCTADFRYVLLAQPAAAMFVSYYIGYAAQQNSKGYKYSALFAVVLCCVFGAMSIMHFC